MKNENGIYWRIRMNAFKHLEKNYLNFGGSLWLIKEYIIGQFL